MNKVLLILLSFLLVFSMTACMSGGETETVEPAAEPVEEADSGIPMSGDVAMSSLMIIENHEYGKNYQFAGNVLPKAYEAKAGDVITLHIEGTVDNAVVSGVNDAGTPTALELYPVDTTPEASWWTPLVSEDKYFRISDPIEAGGSFSFDMTFTLEKDATGTAGAGAIKLCIGSAHEQAEVVTMTISSFTYEIAK